MLVLEDLPLPCPVNRLWRSGGGRVYLSAEANKKTKDIVAAIHDRIGGPPKPMQGDVAVYMQWWRRDEGRRADCDAYIKGLLDALTKAGVWVDDSQVVMVQCELMPDRRFPGLISVTVEEVGG